MIEARTLWELVEQRADATPDALFALDETGSTLDFGGFRDAALRTAAGLFGLGIGEGTSVSWILPTRPSALVLMAALARLGCVQNPIVPIYRHREIRLCLRQTAARWLLVPQVVRGFDFAELARELADEIPGLGIQHLEPALPEGDPATLPAARRPGAPLPVAPEPVRWIFYTSGTTADPKGARHTDGAILTSSKGLAESIDLRPSDRAGVVFPVTHLGGANALAASLFSGSAQLLVENFDAKTSIPFLAKHGVTHAGAGTVFHRAYLEAQRAAGHEPIFPNIRVFHGGGAPKPPQLHYDLEREIGGLGILSAYGMTECPIVSVVRATDPDVKRANTEGRPSPAGARVRVVRLDGVEAAPNEEGELRVSGPQLFRGYVDAALDVDAFDEQGFFRTGDLGTVDPDGYVVVTGRVKDVIIRKGENISVREIEELLLQHPKVADNVVIGLPDAERGERCCAVVICRDVADPLRFDEMVDHLKKHRMMLQKIPEQLELVAELPRNPSGKVIKSALRDRFSDPPA